MNHGAERLFGYAADEVIGKPATILILPEHEKEELGILERRTSILVKLFVDAKKEV